MLLAFVVITKIEGNATGNGVQKMQLEWQIVIVRIKTEYKRMSALENSLSFQARGELGHQQGVQRRMVLVVNFFEFFKLAFFFALLLLYLT